MIANHYLVQTPEASFTFIGSAIRDGSHIWLCSPNGRRIMRVPARQVKQTTAEQLARRIQEEIREHRLRN